MRRSRNGEISLQDLGSLHVGALALVIAHLDAQGSHQRCEHKVQRDQEEPHGCRSLSGTQGWQRCATRIWDVPRRGGGRIMDRRGSTKERWCELWRWKGRVPLGVAVAKQQRRWRMSIVYCTNIRWSLIRQSFLDDTHKRSSRGWRVHPCATCQACTYCIL